MSSLHRWLSWATIILCGIAAPAWAQLSDPTKMAADEISLAIRNVSMSATEPAQQQGSGLTARHIGVGALLKDLVVDFRYLPSRENLVWTGVGGGLALSVHPFDDNVNRALVGNETAMRFFRAGAVLGRLGTLLGASASVYTGGRIADRPRVTHVGADLIQALAMSEALTQSLKYTTGRERPDQSGDNSFPSGHAADTFAFATALARHVGWRFGAPAYGLASYVAISRLPANRHWLSDVVFGAAVGIIAGRTVTPPEVSPSPLTVTYVPGGGVAIVFVH